MTPISNLDPYEEAIFDNWLKTYKSSALSRLIMQSVEAKPLYPGDIATRINDLVAAAWSVDEKSLHRTLRRLTQLDLLDYQLESAAKTGAKRKIYGLTESGAKVLSAMQSVSQV